jgi:hypothetical protein
MTDGGSNRHCANKPLRFAGKRECLLCSRSLAASAAAAEEEED